VGVRHHVELDIEQLTAGDLWKEKDRLADQEAFLRASYAEFRKMTEDEREALVAVVRSTLIRLAATDHWMPGAVNFAKGRIDMHISIDLTHADTLVHMGPDSLSRAAGRVRAYLEDLAERLEAMADE
jgi:hypothetical protein